MHEMSIVSGILQIAGDEARAAGAAVIRAVEVEVGELAGVELEALRFCFAAARQGTDATRDAELVVHEIPGRGFCAACNRESALAYPAPVCTTCGALVNVTRGRELRVRSITVD